MRSYSSLLEGLANAMSSLVNLLSAEVLFFGHDFLRLAKARRLEQHALDGARLADSASSGPTTASGFLSHAAKEHRSGYQQTQQGQHHYHYYWE